MGIIKSDGTFTLKCEDCGQKITQHSDFIFFEVEDKEVKNMGTRIWHGAHTELSCENCKNFIEASFSLVEYPEGSEEKKDYEISGAKLIEDLNYWVAVEEPPENRENR